MLLFRPDQPRVIQGNTLVYSYISLIPYFDPPQPFCALIATHTSPAIKQIPAINVAYRRIPHDIDQELYELSNIMYHTHSIIWTNIPKNDYHNHFETPRSSIDEIEVDFYKKED